jgi:ribosome recycling factor
MNDDIVEQLETRTKPLLDGVRQDFSGIRANRPTPQLVEDIFVEYAGQTMRVKQLGSISVQPPRDILITVWDKSIVSAVSKAVEAARGIAPSVEGTTIRLRMPSLTAERREEFTKLAKGVAEKARIKLRLLRDETIKEISRAENARAITEDQRFKLKEQVQESIDAANREIENILEAKVREINE